MRLSRGVLSVAVIAACAAALLSGQQAGGAPAAGAKAQTVCPIMGGKINKAQYVDVEGHRVYMCCGGCAAKIKADPAKAMEKIRARGEEPERLAAAAAVAAPAKADGSACGGSCGACPVASKAGKNAEAGSGSRAGHIDANGINALLRAGVPMVVLDARSGQFDDGRRIPTAKSLNAESSAEAVGKAIPSKDALVVTYCVSVQCPASNKLAKRLLELGYTNIIEFPDGMAGWDAAGHKTEGAAKPAASAG